MCVCKEVCVCVEWCVCIYRMLHVTSKPKVSIEHGHTLMYVNSNPKQRNTNSGYL